MSEPTNQTQSNKNIILSFLSYLALFVGTGFISGSIVHSGDLSQIPKYTIIGITGVSLFLAGSFVQEFIINKQATKTGIIKFFFFSLLLSIGIGMISGGTQHFSDFPLYSSYLIPLGLILSLIAFLFKNNITKQLWTAVIATFVLVSIPLYLGLNTYANYLVNNQKDSCKTSFLEIKVLASGGHNEINCDATKTPHSTTKTSTMKMSSDIMKAQMDNSMMKAVDDQSFLEAMIPHHQEAVDSSTKIINTTKDLELKTFGQNVVTAQNKEITEMKTWYKSWFNKEYAPSNNYMVMMGGINNKTGTELDQEYIRGMIAHHNGAIEMAKNVQTISKRPEIIKLVNDIITSQSAEIKTLEKRLEPEHDDSGTDAH